MFDVCIDYFCSDEVEIPTTVDKTKADEISKNCKLYNSRVHTGAFCVPNFVEELAKGE